MNANVLRKAQQKELAVQGIYQCATQEFNRQPADSLRLVLLEDGTLQPFIQTFAAAFPAAAPAQEG